MIFDSHAHYDDPAFDEDREELLSSMKENGVACIVNAGTRIEHLMDTIRLTEKYSFIYGALGVHPDELDDIDEEKLQWMKSLCSHEKIVAVGEIGLDYHWNTFPREVQKKWFERQLELAKEVDLPVIIHSRDAAQDTFDIIKKKHAGTTGGVIHCYSGSAQMAKEYVKLGYYIGVGGVVTFKTGRVLKEVVQTIPLEHILIETDCPYLSPVPNRGKRNSSLNLPYVVEEVARLKGISVEEAEEVTFENAKKMYRL